MNGTVIGLQLGPILIEDYPRPLLLLCFLKGGYLYGIGDLLEFQRFCDDENSLQRRVMGQSAATSLEKVVEVLLRLANVFIKLLSVVRCSNRLVAEFNHIYAVNLLANLTVRPTFENLGSDLTWIAIKVWIF